MREAITQVERIINERKVLNAINNLFVNDKKFIAHILKGTDIIFTFCFEDKNKLVLCDDTKVQSVHAYWHTCINFSFFFGIMQKDLVLIYRNNGKKYNHVESKSRELTKINFNFENLVINESK